MLLKKTFRFRRFFRKRYSLSVPCVDCYSLDLKHSPKSSCVKDMNPGTLFSSVNSYIDPVSSWTWFLEVSLVGIGSLGVWTGRVYSCLWFLSFFSSSWTAIGWEHFYLPRHPVCALEPTDHQLNVWVKVNLCSFKFYGLYTVSQCQESDYGIGNM